MTSPFSTLLDQMAQTTEAALTLARRALARVASEREATAGQPGRGGSAPRVARPGTARPESARPETARPRTTRESTKAGPRVRTQVPAATRMFLVGPGDEGADGRTVVDLVSSLSRAAAEAAGWSVDYATAAGHPATHEVAQLRAAAVLVVVVRTASDPVDPWIGVAVGARKPVVLLTPTHLTGGAAHAGVAEYPQGRVLTFRSHEDCRRQLLGILRRVRPVTRA